jgi:hypothetical protein
MTARMLDFDFREGGAFRMRLTYGESPHLPGGTLVTVRCEDVPAGIRPEEHQAGLMSTLDNLAAFPQEAGE